MSKLQITSQAVYNELFGKLTDYQKKVYETLESNKGQYILNDEGTYKLYSKEDELIKVLGHQGVSKLLSLGFLEHVSPESKKIRIKNYIF